MQWTPRLAEETLYDVDDQIMMGLVFDPLNISRQTIKMFRAYLARSVNYPVELDQLITYFRLREGQILMLDRYQQFTVQKIILSGDTDENASVYSLLRRPSDYHVRDFLNLTLRCVDSTVTLDEVAMRVSAKFGFQLREVIALLDTIPEVDSSELKSVLKN